jgi:nicotinamide-nucleotide amidase
MTSKLTNHPEETSTALQTAAILAIGTEVSSGEIINSNASWLAANLDACGMDVVLHMAVADDAAAILAALDFCSVRARHILTIGGLGPTTDDFTRDMIAKWAAKEMSFDPPSWERIADRFQKLGRTAPESNKQQCFFPVGSKILFNSEGSANGFSLDHNQTEVTVLPGPPRELHAIWRDHLQAKFSAIGAQGNKPRLHTWACLGVPESTLAEQVETLMEGSGLQLGYRASAPIVHVKVWAPKEASVKPWLDKLDQALAPVSIAKDGADPLKAFREKLKSAHLAGKKFELYDEVTAGILGARLADLLRPAGISFSITTACAMSDARPDKHEDKPADETIELALLATPDGARLTIRYDQKIESKNYPTGPMPAANDALQINRTRMVMAERALIDIARIF